jgi:hypothetical protein
MKLPPYTLAVQLVQLEAENHRLKRSRSFWRWMVVFLIAAFLGSCHLR